MSTLYVTSLADLKGHLAQLRPDRLVSLLGDEPFPPTPLFMADGHHLRLRFHDIVLEADEARAANLVPPGEPDVARLIEVADLWDGAGSLVVHCFAGVSRSTAAALVILARRNPRREDELARLLRARAPHAQPNRRMVAIADRLLEADGRLVAAVGAMGPGRYEGHAPLVALPTRLG